MERAAGAPARQPGGGGAVILRENEVHVRLASGLELQGTLAVPHDASAIVLFAHGSGSSRMSPRNRFVASVLQRAGLATLLVDLLTPAEEEQQAYARRLRPEIDLLAERLVHIAHWLTAEAATSRFAIGYYGASTGAAAALVAAAHSPEHVGALVSRGGRPDLAGNELEHVRAPTLLIVGGSDRTVIDLNQDAFDRLRTEKELAVVPEATHLFEEPGAMEKVAAMALHWFAEHLIPSERRWSGQDLWT